MESLKTKNHGVHEQRNKGHKKLSAKLMKRRDGERKRKQDKKSKDKKRDKKENRTARLDKYVGKLLRFCEGDPSEILELFQQLDDGAMVGITGLESEVLQKLLKKIFKLLEMQKNTDKEYFKPEGYECVKLKMERLFKRAATKASGKEAKEAKPRGRSTDRDSARSESDGESDSEGDPDEHDDADSSESDGPVGGKRSHESTSVMEDELAPKTKKPTEPNQPKKALQAPSNPVYGPPRPTNAMDMESGSQANVRIDIMKASALLKTGLDNQPDDLFSAVLNRTSDYKNDHRDKLRQGLLKHPKDLIELPEEELAKAEKARRAVEEYDRLHRPKTLLEIHQEAKKGTGRKGEVVHDGPELFSLGGVARVDSKKVFTMLSSAGSGLSTRFSDGLDTNQSVNKLKQNFM